jgi:type I restriction enzyme S subunit
LVPEYLLHTLISGSYKRHLLNIAGAAGATREALTKEQVENLMIPVPPKSLQEKFSAIKARVKSVVLTGNTVTNLLLFESLSQKAFAGEL